MRPGDLKTHEITAVFCNECGGEREISGLMDYNIKEIDEQYRKASDNIGGYAIINNQPPSMTMMVNCWAVGVVLIAILTPDGVSLSAHPEGRRKS